MAETLPAPQKSATEELGERYEKTRELQRRDQQEASETPYTNGIIPELPSSVAEQLAGDRYEDPRLNNLSALADTVAEIRSGAPTDEALLPEWDEARRARELDFQTAFDTLETDGVEHAVLEDILEQAFQKAEARAEAKVVQNAVVGDWELEQPVSYQAIGQAEAEEWRVSRILLDQDMNRTLVLAKEQGEDGDIVTLEVPESALLEAQKPAEEEPIDNLAEALPAEAVEDEDDEPEIEPEDTPEALAIEEEDEEQEDNDEDDDDDDVDSVDYVQNLLNQKKTENEASEAEDADQEAEPVKKKGFASRLIEKLKERKESAVRVTGGDLKQTLGLSYFAANWSTRRFMQRDIAEQDSPEEQEKKRKKNRVKRVLGTAAVVALALTVSSAAQHGGFDVGAIDASGLDFDPSNAPDMPGVTDLSDHYDKFDLLNGDTPAPDASGAETGVEQLPLDTGDQPADPEVVAETPAPSFNLDAVVQSGEGGEKFFERQGLTADQWRSVANELSQFTNDFYVENGDVRFQRPGELSAEVQDFIKARFS